MSAAGPSAPSPPRATYRVQLGRGCGFTEVTALLPYLDALGVSHVYCSPYLKARPGSTHGYDIVDHNAFNPEIGDATSFAAFVAALRRHGMGHVLDFVPNHMGVARADNAWWLDVLAWGRSAEAAPYFDVDWTPGKRELADKVLLPFLGDHYGRVLERGELGLRFDPAAGSFSVWYHDHRFPISPAQYGRVLGAPERRLALSPRGQRALGALMDRVRALRARAAIDPERAARGAALERALAALAAREPAFADWIAARLARLNGVQGRPRSFAALHRLLEAQHYRLAFWRVAADEINYRRFFDVNDLAGLCMEHPGLFARTHGLVARLVADGALDGLRIDHVDGLYDPRQYLERLRALVGPAAWIVVEKILAPHERLPATWPVAGTTGYDFLARTGALFVDPEAEPRLDALYRELAHPDVADFGDLAYLCKKHVMNFLLASELQVLATGLDRLSELAWRWRDFTATSLREALKDTVACLRVYRTYLDAEGASDADRAEVTYAVAEARRRSADPEPSLFDFVAAVLAADPAPAAGAASREAADGAAPPRAEVLRFARRLQQLTGAVAAKGVEDTAFYRHARLLALNEVGGDPRRFGLSPAEFHAGCEEQARSHPHGMLATATHDTKRGEDVRARLAVLSELPDRWEARVRAWMRLAAPRRRVVDGRAAPTTTEQYFLFQTLLGSWPAELTGVSVPDAAALAAYRRRLSAYVVKALREAKEHTSWRHRRPAWEDAVVAFVDALLEAPAATNPFLADFLPFEETVALVGVRNALAQLLLKLTAPGVPDVYQGTELWDLSLVDPDNRRPVDWEARARLLASLRARLGDPPRGDAEALRALLADWRGGAPKLLLLWRMLAHRRADPALYAHGAHRPLAATGLHAERVCAFARTAAARTLVVVAPYRSAALQHGAGPLVPAHAWGDTAVVVDAVATAPAWRCVVSGAVTAVSVRDGRSVLELARLLAAFPVAALVPEPVGGAAGAA